jgi:hypothetical protein
MRRASSSRCSAVLIGRGSGRPSGKACRSSCTNTEELIMSKATTKEVRALLETASEMFDETGCVPGIDGEEVRAETMVPDVSFGTHRPACNINRSLVGKRPCVPRCYAHYCVANGGGVSITSSACTSSDGGIVIPSLFAVQLLMTNSNRVACRSGNSLGRVPPSTFATCSAALV